jgi:hypothetical protein
MTFYAAAPWSNVGRLLEFERFSFVAGIEALQSGPHMMSSSTFNIH